jgi:hypothetical protein
MLLIESWSVRGFIVHARNDSTSQTYKPNVSEIKNWNYATKLFPSAQKRKRIAVKVESDKISEAAREYRNPGFKAVEFR